tara:strand:- start:198 stop:503 length:306 start_codon:yes stop_codon:yes gene_type:complete
MAKVSSIEKNEKRKQLAAKHYQERAKLRAIIKDPKSSDDDVIVAQFTLNSKKRDESPSRVRNRCRHCGRPRGVYRFFGLCRCCIRLYVSKGWLPGVEMSSW